LTLGVNIRKARRALGMNQATFAKKLKVSQSAVSNWERGQDKPTIESLYQLSELFGDQSFISIEILRNKPQPLPQAPKTNASPLIDGLLDILSRLEAVEQEMKIISSKKKVS
jgi:transcriptional regulator with XRE-family HTH domain